MLATCVSLKLLFVDSTSCPELKYRINQNFQVNPELSFNPELQVNLMLCEIGFLFSLLEEEGCSYRNS